MFRKLKNGKKYNALIPYSSCERVSFGKGDTFYSVDKIATQALQHSNQVAKLAKVLKQEAKNNTLQEIANTIHSFLYWHLQYKADGEAQLLRSPACAWQQRYDGVDCKSYSIFASAILLQLGIKHYIRQIKQPNLNPNDYTHVYVVVPKNQSSANLDDGYYTIDGTLQHTNEPVYLIKDDTFMNRLPHYGLNGLAETQDTSGENQDYSWVSDAVSDFDFGSLFDSIDCWFGTAFDADKLKNLIPVITKYFFGIIDEYNSAIVAQNFSEVDRLYQKFWQRRMTLLKTYHVKYSEGWNSCSNASFIFVFDFLNNKIANILGKSFEAHYKSYFTVNSDRLNVISWSKLSSTGDTFDGVEMWGTYVGSPASISDMTVRDWDTNPKPHQYSENVELKTDKVSVFIITDEIKKAINSDVKTSSFNVQNFLNELVATAPLLDFSNSDSYNDQNPNNPYQTATPTTQKAGFGVVGNVLLASAAAKLAWEYFKNKKQK